MAAQYWTLPGIYLHLNQIKVLQLFAETEQTSIEESNADPVYVEICALGAATDSQVEAYLRGHVPLPLETIPAELADMACALLACRLVAVKSEIDELPDKLKQLEKRAIRFFEQIAAGLIKFESLPDAPAAAVWCNKTRYDRMFDISDMRRRM